MDLPLNGGCMCGAIRYRISSPPKDAGYCHCRMCQRSTGAPVVAWFTMASSDFDWIEGTPAVYRSSADAERLFCPTCGTQMVFREFALPELLDVTVASLDDPMAIRPDHHIWTSSRIGWFEVADDLPRHSEGGPASSG